MKVTTTMTVSARVEICSFATLVRAYEKEGLFLRSKSDVLWQAVEQLSQLFVRKHDEEPFTDVREAVDYMLSIGLPLETNTRAAREVAMAKMRQDAGEDYGLGGLEQMAQRVSKKSLRQHGVDKMGPAVSDAERDAYQQYVGVLKDAGQRIPTFDEYKSGLAKVRERMTIDEEAFKRKEAARMQEEKEAYAAMLSMRSTSGSGSGSGDD